jgi:hypothetical protein
LTHQALILKLIFKNNYLDKRFDTILYQLQQIQQGDNPFSSKPIEARLSNVSTDPLRFVTPGQQLLGTKSLSTDCLATSTTCPAITPNIIQSSKLWSTCDSNTKQQYFNTQCYDLFG